MLPLGVDVAAADVGAAAPAEAATVGSAANVSNVGSMTAPSSTPSASTTVRSCETVGLAERTCARSPSLCVLRFPCWQGAMGAAPAGASAIACSVLKEMEDELAEGKRQAANAGAHRAPFHGACRDATGHSSPLRPAPIRPGCLHVIARHAS